MRRTSYILIVLVILFFGNAASGSPVRPPKGFGSHSAARGKKSHAAARPAPRAEKPVSRRSSASAREDTASNHESRATKHETITNVRRQRASLRPAVAHGVRERHAEAVSLSVPAVPPLRGSYESLVRQNVKSEADGLERIEDDDDLRDHVARKQLVPLPASPAMAVNSVPEDRRFCRPWTAGFLTDLATAHEKLFHHALEVSSAVRTVDFQKHLMHINGNAAPAEGDVASPHLTGATIDIAKHGLNRKELAWMRTYLLPLEQAGKIDVEEEFRQACFHITVYKSYAPPELQKTMPQQHFALPAGLPVEGE